MIPERVVKTGRKRRRALSVVGLVVGVCIGALTGCGDQKATGSNQTSPAEAEDLIPSLKKDLPPEVARELKLLLEREQEWLAKPPKEFSSAQLDQEFADLHWEVAQKFGSYDVEGAISYARSSLRMDEAHPARWEQLGDLYNLSGELTSATDAANAYDNAVFLDPRAVGARRKLAAALMMLGKSREAAVQLELCLVKVDEKTQRELVPLYATACADAGEYARGLAFCKARAGTEKIEEYRVTWAIFENALGHRDEAIKLLAGVEKDAGKPSAMTECAKALRINYEAGKGGGK